MRNRAVKTMRTTSVYRVCSSFLPIELNVNQEYSPVSANLRLKAGLPLSSVSRVNIGALEIGAYSQTVLIDEALDHAFHSSSTGQVITVNAQFYVEKY